jgi:hypothetical protein
MQKRPKLDDQCAARGSGSSPTDSECEGSEAYPAAGSDAARCAAVVGVQVQVRVGSAAEKRNFRVSLEDLETPRSRM